MNNPALKGEVSKNKMLSKTNPRLRRVDVVRNSFGSCITDAPEELSRAPEVSSPEIVSQPRMLVQKFESTVAFEQLQGFANAHCRRQLDKEMDVVNSDMHFIDFTSISPSGCVENSLAINPHSEKLHRVHGVFTFPDKMKSILSKRMFSGFQIHFFAPANLTENLAHAKFAKFSSRGATAPLHNNSLHNNYFKELNFEDGNSSLGFKTEVPLPLM